MKFPFLSSAERTFQNVEATVVRTAKHVEDDVKAFLSEAHAELVSIEDKFMAEVDELGQAMSRLAQQQNQAAAEARAAKSLRASLPAPAATDTVTTNG